MIIKNAKIFTQNGTFEKCDIEFDDRIRKIGNIDCGADIDAEGCYVIPGLVDIHTHGAIGYDASDGSKKGLLAMSRYYARNGVTSFCATTMTLGEDTLTSVMHTVRDFIRPSNGARCVGIYLEGPFLSYGKRGAQAAEYLHEPDIEMFNRLNSASGDMVKIVGIAPELPYSKAFIKYVSSISTVSLAHTTANYEIAMEAFENGTTQVTHLFNGMNPFLHREPGVVGAALDNGACVELICDGLHIHPAVMRAVFTMFDGRIILISDSLRCAGMPDGDYELGGQPIVVKDSKATLLDGTLAGSSISILDAIRNLISFGITLEKAVAAATIVPTHAIGMQDSIGSLSVDKNADLLILDSSLHLLKTIIGGEVIE